MPKAIAFQVRWLSIDGRVRSSERLRATLQTWPEISDVEWPNIQTKLQNFCRKRGLCCKIKYQNGTDLEDLCGPNSLRRFLQLHREALGSDCVLPLFLFADPTDDSSVGMETESEEIVLEVEEKGGSVALKLKSNLLLGRGGFGKVQRTLHGENYVAVKISHPNQRAQDSMKTEISTLLQLNHPNIIKVVQHGHVLHRDHGRLPAYMMDLGRCSVAALLETGWHNKAAAEAAERDVGSALQHLHAARLGHMDVKPGNWLVTNKFTGPAGETQLTLKLIDAGAVGRLGKDQVACCTKNYAHPLLAVGVPEIKVSPLAQPFYDLYGLQKAVLQLQSSDSEKTTLTEKQVLQKASRTLAKDKEFVLQAVQQDGLALRSACKEFKSDKEVVMAAVREDGRALLFASETLQSDKHFVMAAVREDGCALEFASEILRSDKKVVMAAVRKSGRALEFASETPRSDKEVVMEAVRKDGLALEFAREPLRSDKEVVMEAVRKDGLALEFASETLRSDKEVVMEAVRKDGLALEFASKILQRDKEVFMEALRTAGCSAVRCGLPARHFEVTSTSSWPGPGRTPFRWNLPARHCRVTRRSPWKQSKAKQQPWSPYEKSESGELTLHTLAMYSRKRKSSSWKQSGRKAVP